MTCSWHVFTNSESTNPLFFSPIFLFFFQKRGRFYLLRLKMLLELFIFTQNKTFFVNKIRGFVDSEFVKTCHEPHLSFKIVKKKSYSSFLAASPWGKKRPRLRRRDALFWREAQENDLSAHQCKHSMKVQSVVEF